MTKLGQAAGVTFDFNAYIDRQPIESQRLLLWAGRYGKRQRSSNPDPDPNLYLNLTLTLTLIPNSDPDPTLNQARARSS